MLRKANNSSGQYLSYQSVPADSDGDYQRAKKILGQFLKNPGQKLFLKCYSEIIKLTEKKHWQELILEQDKKGRTILVIAIHGKFKGAKDLLEFIHSKMERGIISNRIEIEKDKSDILFLEKLLLQVSNDAKSNALMYAISFVPDLTSTMLKLVRFLSREKQIQVMKQINTRNANVLLISAHGADHNQFIELAEYILEFDDGTMKGIATQIADSGSALLIQYHKMSGEAKKLTDKLLEKLSQSEMQNYIEKVAFENLSIILNEPHQNHFTVTINLLSQMSDVDKQRKYLFAYGAKKESPAINLLMIGLVHNFNHVDTLMDLIQKICVIDKCKKAEGLDALRKILTFRDPNGKNAIMIAASQLDSRYLMGVIKLMHFLSAEDQLRILQTNPNNGYDVFRYTKSEVTKIILKNYVIKISKQRLSAMDTNNQVLDIQDKFNEDSISNTKNHLTFFEGVFSKQSEDVASEDFGRKLAG